jgi:hypothetical protein
VESPPKDGHTDLVIKALEGDVVVIAEATLPSNNGETFDCNVEPDKRSGAPPDAWVADEVNLSLYSCE